MSLHAIATIGLRSIQQIAKLHDLRFHHDQNGLVITVELLTSSLPGVPVANAKGALLDLSANLMCLSALEAGRDVSQLSAENIMVQDHLAINHSTTLSDVVKLMKEKHFLILPIEQAGVVIGALPGRTFCAHGLGQKV
jgi:predicted transcriptional regulator